MSTTAKFLWQIVLGLSVGLAAIGVTWLFDSVWPGAVFLIAWILGYRVWWYRRRSRRRSRRRY